MRLRRLLFRGATRLRSISFLYAVLCFFLSWCFSTLSFLPSIASVGMKPRGPLDLRAGENLGSAKGRKRMRKSGPYSEVRHNIRKNGRSQATTSKQIQPTKRQLPKRQTMATEIIKCQACFRAPKVMTIDANARTKTLTNKT